MKRAFSSLMLIFLALRIFSQETYTVTGKVADADTRAPLAFVNILIANSRTGGTTDIDGKFTITSDKPFSVLNLTYVGYYPQSYLLEEGRTKNVMISLKPMAVDLEEVVVYPTVNPAHRIIENVIANRDRNNPEKLGSFAYTAYERTILTIKLDTLNLPDSILADTSFIETRDMLNRQDIAIMETVVERKFMAPDRNYENVIANRVSGFQDPIFVFLISQVQSTSFYNELFQIGEKYYVNPISGGSTSKYIFLLEDTLYSGQHDSVFIISYRPRPGTNFDGLEGLLYIHTHGWAIQNAIARPAREETFSIRIQQQYELIDSLQWFPRQLNTDVIFDIVGVEAGEVKAQLVGIGKSYISDIEMNPELVRRQFATLGIDVEPDSHQKPEEYWDQFRIDSLTARDRRTYAFMDSIGREANFDRISRSFETIISGKVPYKFLDIDLDRIINYNQYQGIYLGLGLHTNDKLSRHFQVGGYWGYGFKDMTAKYGGDLSITLSRKNELALMAEYYSDALETGGVDFLGEKKNILTGENWRDFMIRRMNPTESMSGGVTFRALRDFRFNVGLQVSRKMTAGDYHFLVPGDELAVGIDVFDFTEVRAGFRFAFREEFITTKRKKISLGTKYPVVHFQYTLGLAGFLGGDYEFNRFDLKIQKSFYTRYVGKTTLELCAGFIDQPVPESNLYNGNGSYRIFTLFAPNSFATMRMNEFMSDRYVALYFTHSFGKLLKRFPKFEPEFSLLTNIGFGSLSGREHHTGHEFDTMEMGYYESGFLVDNLLNLRVYRLGAGAFYRWGPYGFDQAFDNVAFKVSISFPLGFGQ